MKKYYLLLAIFGISQAISKSYGMNGGGDDRGGDDDKYAFFVPLERTFSVLEPHVDPEPYNVFEDPLFRFGTPMVRLCTLVGNNPRVGQEKNRRDLVSLEKAKEDMTNAIKLILGRLKSENQKDRAKAFKEGNKQFREAFSMLMKKLSDSKMWIDFKGSFLKKVGRGKKSKVKVPAEFFNMLEENFVQGVHYKKIENAANLDAILSPL